MPYKWATNKIPLPRDKDRRVKLTDSERDQIRDLDTVMGKKKIANLYGVSKRLVQFICDPSKQGRNVQLRKDRGGSMQYYDKDKSTSAIREHSRYKQSVMKDLNLKKESK